ncbi:MAG TPA: RecX family transcriptional regulator [Acidobacteriota bacterium]|nr:RecX family transcriptional regulator [Acidobacteriota bacterium]
MDGEIHKLLMKKAGAILARRAHSRAELQAKLADMADEVEVEAVLERLERLNLLNDFEYAYNFALRRMRRLGWSRTRVENALLGHQVSSAVIERALEKMNESGGEQSVLNSYLLKRYGKSGLPADVKGVRKLILHLRQRGFEEENILGALRGKIPDATLQRFETGEYFD